MDHTIYRYSSRAQYWTPRDSCDMTHTWAEHQNNRKSLESIFWQKRWIFHGDRWFSKRWTVKNLHVELHEYVTCIYKTWFLRHFYLASSHVITRATTSSILWLITVKFVVPRPLYAAACRLIEIKSLNVVTSSDGRNFEQSQQGNIPYHEGFFLYQFCSHIGFSLSSSLEIVTGFW